MIWTVVGTLGIVTVAIAVGRYLDKRTPKLEKLRDGNIEVRVQRPPKPPAKPPTPGESAATAIRAGAHQLAKLRTIQRCQICRGPLEADGPDEELRYADRALLLLPFRCPSCVRKRSLYVIPTG